MKKSYLCLSCVSILFFIGCSSKQEISNLQLELPSVNECINVNESVQVDCYKLMSSRNSFAQLRLGILAEEKKDYKEAFNRYTLAKSKNNFYANSFLSNLYKNGFGVRKNEKLALDLLEDVQDIDPIAAYKLGMYFMEHKKYSKAISLFEFAGKNHVKDAQKELANIYGNVENKNYNDKKQLFWQKMYENKKPDFRDKIVGLKG